MTLKDTLTDRGKIYGDYGETSYARGAIMTILRERTKRVTGKDMTAQQEAWFHDVTLKIVRAAGTPTYTDSWHDLAGYATRIEEHLTK